MSYIASAAVGLQAIGQMAQGEGNAAAINRQGDIAFQNVEATRQQTSANEDTLRRQQAMRLGHIRASAAESGFLPGTGSLADLQTRSAGEMELDALTQRYKGELQSIGLTNEGNSYRANAKSARRSGYLNAAGTLLSGAAMAYGSPRVGPPAPVETRIPVPTGRP